VTGLLELRDVEVAFARRGASPLRAVVGVSLTVSPGEVVGLVGESGCGKSSLGKAAVGLVPLAGGEVLYDGSPVETLGRRARPQRIRSLQMIFQDPYASLNPRRRVGEQIGDAIGLGTGRSLSSSEQAGRVDALLERVGLSPQVARRFPYEFSGGQCQRIAIARVLATEPRCIIADEPISALDASAQAQIANLAVSVAKESGLGMLFISHDLSIVRKIADRTVVMYLGQVVESGNTEELWSSPSHPYTRALIGAIPRPGGSSELPAELPGDVPNPARPPSGCRFHPRCPQVMDRCRTEAPPFVAVAAGWRSACWLSEPRARLASGAAAEDVARPAEDPGPR
jgi:oligopeptide/dipeptide ABC transporter ATP-binding protein